MSLELGGTDWFAVQVRTRWEQSTTKILSGKGYETVLPVYESERPRGGRPGAVIAPLFPGYVFCRFDVRKRLPILVTPGVVSIVSRGRVPAPIEPCEMGAIQTLVSSGAQAEPWPYLEVGERVRIEDTALQGVEGILVAFKGSRRIVVSVSLLQRSVALEIDRAQVSPVRESPEAIAPSHCWRAAIA
jgi:transcription antitermination factor NusG